MSGKRQKTQYTQLRLAFASERRGESLGATAKGPNHSWRSEAPKARHSKNS